MQQLPREGNPQTETDRAARFSTGTVLVLIGVLRRSVAGAIVSVLGGRLAYSAFRNSTADKRESHGPVQGAPAKASIIHGGEKPSPFRKDEKREHQRAARSAPPSTGGNGSMRPVATVGVPKAETERRDAMSWKQLFLNRRVLWELLKQTFSNWNADRAPSLGAAMAYYTMFSISPLLVIAIAVVGLVFGKQAAQSTIVHEIGGLVGTKGMDAIQTMLQSTHRPGMGTVAGLFGVITLLLGAAGVFGELQDALDAIWQVRSQQQGLWRNLKNRFISYGMVLGVGFLLLVSLLLSAALAAVGKFFGGLLPFSEIILHVLNLAVSFGVVTVLFAMIFKVLPQTPVAWRDVWAGAAITAALFDLGKLAIGLYLGKSSMASAYGAASSVVVMMAWVYYSAQILYFGAEFTRAYSSKRQGRPQERR